MASTSSATTPESPINIKLVYNGATRKVKLAYRDLAINSLDVKLRGFLGIRPEDEVVFERYSDSAGSFVVLDRANTAVYKQLNRAAKAKGKLKIRATVKTPEPVIEEKQGPKPASVEDVTEDTAAPQAPQSVEPTPEPGVPTEPVAAAETAEPTLPQETMPAKVVDGRNANTRELEIRLRREQLASYERHRLAIAAALKAQESVAAEKAVPATAASPVVTPPSTTRTNYAVCCNSCDRTIPEAHYHCNTCDDGDFDLCQDCVDHGITCNDASHWMIKRLVKNGVIINSVTERIAPKPKAKPQPASEATGSTTTLPQSIQNRLSNAFYSSIRTCNSCVQELPEVEFVHCTSCEDFDLCRACFAKNRHGHHPKHGFVAAVEGTRLEPEVSRRLAPGRRQSHNAICDGCDAGIEGIRHKCLDCPDWDYCSECVEDAAFIHPGHRFVPVYEPLELASAARIRAQSRPTHVGICCDGPLCADARSCTSYIVGDRYKCAVCHDTDFCASCEASPANTHNKTHPLIKFKTPVRHASVTTSGEHENGRPMPAMGDRPRALRSFTNSRATETAPQNLATNVMTVVDVKPDEPTSAATEVKSEKEVKLEEVDEKPTVAEKSPAPEDLNAIYVRDTVPDGTVFGPNYVFEQTWVLRNEGRAAWPAGCAVRYVGGDYMGHVDSSHPAATEDLESTAESTICFRPVEPGEEFPFTVLLRTPQRNGRIVSNWRLTTNDGIKFGHRLWCDVVVKIPEVEAVQPEKTTVEETPVETASEKAPAPDVEEPQHSQMIFPKLEKESPVASVHEETQSEQTTPEEEYADCAEDEEWNDSEAYLTDEEYDILDASDEDYLDHVSKK